MGIYKENIPKADMLMGSMRSMGYSFESAIADVIDNSISAGCSYVSLFFPTDSFQNKQWAFLTTAAGCLVKNFSRQCAMAVLRQKQPALKMI